MCAGRQQFSSATTSLWVDGRLRLVHLSRDRWPQKLHLLPIKLPLIMRQHLRIHIRLDLRMTVETRCIWIRFFFSKKILWS